MKNIGLWVERPDKLKHRVEVIACHEDHLGNAVAEGRLAADEYWPKLVGLYRADLKRVTAEKVAALGALGATS